MAKTEKKTRIYDEEKMMQEIRHEQMREYCYFVLKEFLREELIEETGFIEIELQRIRNFLRIMPKKDVDVINRYIKKYIQPIITDPHYFDFIQEAPDNIKGNYLRNKVLELNEALDYIAFSEKFLKPY